MRPHHFFALALALTLVLAHASAQPLIGSTATAAGAPAAAIEQQLGAQLPLDMQLADDFGRPVRLRQFFDGERPVLLVLGYYRCPQLCGLLMHGLLEGLHASGVPRQGWRIVGISIDPEDTPATARARRDLDLAYADFLMGAQTPDAPLDLHLLTAAAADSQRLAQRVGFVDVATPATDRAALEAGARFAHPAAVMIVTPRGQVSRYLMGISFDADEIRTALAEAAGNRVGTFADGIALLCAHFDPRLGAHSAAVMNGLRALGLLLAGGLGLWCWRRRGTSSGAAR
jgi:protein SCO1